MEVFRREDTYIVPSKLLGHNRERIIQKLQDHVLELLVHPPTDILLDWTSIVIYGDMSDLARLWGTLATISRASAS